MPQKGKTSRTLKQKESSKTSARYQKLKIKKIEKERGTQYNHPNLPKGNILENFTNIGKSWGAILSSYLGCQLEPVPPHIVSHMMAALKSIRAVVPSAYQEDDYTDMINYTKFAGRMDPKNSESDQDTYILQIRAWDKKNL
jgi:hypothetical protein